MSAIKGSDLRFSPCSLCLAVTSLTDMWMRQIQKPIAGLSIGLSATKNRQFT